MPADEMDALLHRARPDTAADRSWIDSTDGHIVLATIHQRINETVTSPRARVRRAVLVAVVGATAAGSSAFTALHVRQAADTGQVLCSQTASITSNGAGVTVDHPTPAAAIAACRQQWTDAYPTTPVPPAFAVCIYPATPGNRGGAQTVIPARQGQSNNAACTAAGFDLITNAPANTG